MSETKRLPKLLGIDLQLLGFKIATERLERLGRIFTLPGEKSRALHAIKFELVRCDALLQEIDGWDTWVLDSEVKAGVQSYLSCPIEKCPTIDNKPWPQIIKLKNQQAFKVIWGALQDCHKWPVSDIVRWKKRIQFNLDMAVAYALSAIPIHLMSGESERNRQRNTDALFSRLHRQDGIVTTTLNDEFTDELNDRDPIYQKTRLLAAYTEADYLLSTWR